MRIDFPGQDQIPQLLQLWKEVFGEYDGFWELFLNTGFVPDHCRCITKSGQVLAALYWFDCSCGSDKIAYVYAVATDPQHRGQGLCRRLMEDVHALLNAQGYASILLVPAEENLREMYQKMGYKTCTTIKKFSCSAAGPAAQVRTLDAEEYAFLRRTWLPESGVLQEGLQLPFLAAQAQLLAGDDFLLAAWREGTMLHGMELLGDPEAAPGILRALGCETGIFQIPGTQIPFAMIHPLQKDAVNPAYFGFAFD